MRIAVLDAGYSIMDSAARAITDLGSEAHLVPSEVDNQFMLRNESRVVSVLEDLCPDVLFIHNFGSLLPHIQEGSNGLELVPSPVLRLVEREGIHVAAWFLDDPLQSSLHFWLLQRFADTGLLSMLLLDRTWIEPCQAYGVATVHLPHCTDPSIFTNPGCTVPVAERLRCDVSIVGASRRNEMIDYKRFLKRFVSRYFDKDEAEKALFEIDSALLFIERTVNADSGEIIRTNLSSRFRSIIEESAGGVWAEFHAPIEWIGSCRQRWYLANLVSDKDLAVFGDEQWPAVLMRPDVYRGSISYRKELPELYSGEAIHLMVNRIQVRTAITQRVYDIAAAGGFSLSDHRSDLDLYLPNVVATYRNLQEVPTLVDKFLAEPDLRRETALRAQEMVLGNHTYRHRMTKLLEHLQTKIGH